MYYSTHILVNVLVCIFSEKMNLHDSPVEYIMLYVLKKCHEKKSHEKLATDNNYENFMLCELDNTFWTILVYFMNVMWQSIFLR